MRKITLFFVLIINIAFSQIGLNTTSPQAALDVVSSNNGVLIPRVQLLDIYDNTTISNPSGGGTITSTLVYNLDASGIAPNNVIEGFYYWKLAALRWIPLEKENVTDHDWYQEGTTIPPNAITDAMFHTGNVAIGKNIANYPLEVNTINHLIGTYNTLNNSTSTNQQKTTIFNEVFDNTNDPKYGIINSLSNNSTTSSGIGIRNNINGNGTTFYGNSNYLIAGATSNNADIIGVRNYISSDSDNGYLKGSYSIFEGTGGALNRIYGSQNDFRASANNKTGTENIFNANTDGDNVGLYNVLSSNFPTKNQFGTWNFFTPGVLTTGNNIGLYNYFIGEGSSSKYGSYTDISSNGDGEHIGNYLSINGSAIGTGTKYGTQTVINSASGGTHYGIHSTVLKPGATNFAGYFLGNVGIGTTSANTYTLPTSRGTNGQVIMTNSAGVTTWASPTEKTAFKIKPSANITSFTNTGETNLIFGNSVFNLGGGTYNSATGAYTIPYSGVYNFTANISWLFSGSTATRMINRFRIYVNGIMQENIHYQYDALNPGYHQNYPFKALLNLSQNDVITFRLFTVWGTANPSPYIDFNLTSISVFKVY